MKGERMSQKFLQSQQHLLGLEEPGRRNDGSKPVLSHLWSARDHSPGGRGQAAQMGQTYCHSPVPGTSTAPSSAAPKVCFFRYIL